MHTDTNFIERRGPYTIVFRDDEDYAAMPTVQWTGAEEVDARCGYTWIADGETLDDVRAALESLTEAS